MQVILKVGVQKITGALKCGTKTGKCNAFGSTIKCHKNMNM